MTLCMACRGSLPERARFCPACGSTVREPDPSGSAFDAVGVRIEAERRHLTVVFCDLVGSTELSTKVDAEEYSDLVQEYQHLAVALARKFEGDVEGYSGDGILFRFGWPEAHDDDAERAVRAALEIVEGVGRSERMTARVGVHTGLVVVGEMGAPDHRATMALGETMNLAARLQGVAEPGTVVASAATVELVGDSFAVETLGGQRLKGIEQPVEAFRVVSRNPGGRRLDAVGRGRTPFIGRDAELAALTDLWVQAAAGSGATVLVTGEPGVGKSRFLYQLREEIADFPHGWLECDCSSYTQRSFLWPVIQLIEQALDLQPDDHPAGRVERVRQALSAAGLDDEESLGLVGELLALPGLEVAGMSPERKRDRTIEVLATWIGALSIQEPLVLMVEDLQWCDSTTLELIGRLLVRVRDLPVLMVMSARPEFTPPPSTGDVTTIHLERLGDGEVRRLVSALGGDRALPEQIMERIVGTAEGIPLFAEEVGRSVLESGLLTVDDERWSLVTPLTGLEIPRSLQSSLLARLDRLGPAKAVAQLASVIGRTFSFDLLAAVSGMHSDVLSDLLSRLVASDLVLVEGAPPSSNYMFRHALIQDIAYESLLRRTRRTVHGRIARALTARVDAGVHIAPEVIARHFEAAASIREAVENFELAARHAAGRSACREAIEFLRHGLALLEDQPADAWRDEIDIEMRLALCSAIIATRGYADPEIEVEYARVRDQCEHLGNDTRVGLALAGLSIYHTNRGRTTLGAELAGRVLEIAEKHGDDTLELLGRVQLALPLSYQGRAAESVDHARRALIIYDPERHRVIAERFGTDHGVAAQVFAGWGDLVQGYLDTGMRHFEAAVTLARSLGQPFSLVYALAFKATSHWERGESQQTLRAAQLARTLAEEQGFALWAGVSGVWEMAERVILTGDHSVVPKVIEASLVAGESGNMGGSTTVMARVAEAVRAAGDLATAWSIAQSALDVAATTEQWWWDSSLHRLRAELLMEAHAGGSELAGQVASPSAAEREWKVALQLADKYGYPVHGLRAAASYATLLQQTERTDEACALVETWYRRCPEGHDAPVVRGAEAVLGRMKAAVGLHED